MPEAYELHEARLVQTKVVTSAANADSVPVGPVPPGKVWTVLLAGYNPSVAETQTCFWDVFTAVGNAFPVSIPVSIALSTTIPLPVLTDGMELRLYPGDYLEAKRAAHTAGSTMTIYVRYIETDLPLYEYIEPQERKRRAQMRGEVFRMMRGGGAAGGGGGSPAPPIGGPRGGGPRAR